MRTDFIILLALAAGSVIADQTSVQAQQWWGAYKLKGAEGAEETLKWTVVSESEVSIDQFHRVYRPIAAGTIAGLLAGVLFTVVR